MTSTALSSGRRGSYRPARHRPARVMIAGLIACSLALILTPSAFADDYPIPCPSAVFGVSPLASGVTPAVSPVAQAACGVKAPTPPESTPPAGTKLSDHASNALIAGGSVIGGLGAGLLVAAATVTAPVWVPWVGAGLLVGGLATLWYAGTHSPANHHYRTIVKPASTKIRSLVAPTANLDAAAAVATKLISHNLQAYALAKAFWSSEDRAHGARNAHNKRWYKRQLRAAAGYASHSASLFKGLPGLESQLQAALLSAGTQDTITASQIATGQHMSGESQRVSAEFQQLGVSKVLRRLGLPKLIEHQSQSATPLTVQFPQALTDPAVVAADRQAALALDLYAKLARRQQHKF